MASNLDLIKEYLIGIGFQIDKESFQSTNNSMDDAKGKVEEFNKKSSKGFSETGNSLKDLFSIFSSSGTIKRLFPNLSKPLQSLITDIKTVKRLYDELDKTNDGKEDVTQQYKSDKEKSNKTVGNIKDKVKQATKTTGTGIIKDKKGNKEPNSNELDLLDKASIENVGASSGEALQKVQGLKEGFKDLLTKGGSSLKTFATSSVVQFALIAGAIMALIIAIKKLISYLKELGDKEIEYEKVSRMLFTTKQNAREVTQALNLLGASLEDLWLSPTLLRQFNELRKDANELRIPPKFYDNLRIVQDIGLEFKRLKQSMSMLFQWIGHYILEYLAGPLVEAKQGMQDFNSWLIQNIPEVAKVIGSFIGGFLRLLLVVGKVLKVLWDLTSPIRWIFKQLGEVKDSIDGVPEKVKKGARIIFAAIVFAFSPILLIIALIDDLLTYFRGGKSVIGDVLDWVKDKWDEFIDKLLDKFWILRSILNIKDEAKEWWASYYENGKDNLDKLRTKAKEVLGEIKEWSQNTFDKGKGWVKDKWDKGKELLFDTGDSNNDIPDFPGFSDKVLNFDRDYGDSSGTVAQSYVTSTSNSTAHNETNTTNEINNKNNINVYANDANQAASVIDRRLQGITVRNLQGGVE